MYRSSYGGPQNLFTLKLRGRELPFGRYRDLVKNPLAMLHPVGDTALSLYAIGRVMGDRVAKAHSVDFSRRFGSFLGPFNLVPIAGARQQHTEPLDPVHIPVHPGH